ncbi:MAG: cobalt ECF transporter T component CbiQ [Nodosilinea sp.]
MGITSLDAYVHRESLIHQWQPRLKLVSLLGLMFAFATVRQLSLLPWMLGLTAGLYALSRLPLTFLWQRLSYPGLFIVAVVAVLPFAIGETVLWQGGWLALRQEGLASTALIVSRFVSILTVGFILLGTTPFLTIVQAMRALGLPVILADMTLLSYRYLYEIADTLATMQQAMGLRGFGHRPQRGFRPSGQMIQQLALLTGNLLLRSYERSERVYKAMRLRGYGYGTKSAVGAMSTAPTPILSWGLTIAVLGLAAGFILAEVMLSTR